MGAAKEGHIEIVQMLLDSGADINAKSAEDKTALIYAEEKGHEYIAQVLRMFGAEEEISSSPTDAPSDEKEMAQ